MDLKYSYWMLSFMTARTQHTHHLHHLDVYKKTKFFMGVGLHEALELKTDMLQKMNEMKVMMQEFLV